MHNAFYEIDCTISDLGLHWGDDAFTATAINSHYNPRINVTTRFKLNPRRWIMAKKLYHYYDSTTNSSKFWNNTVWYPKFNGSEIRNSWYKFRVRLESVLCTVRFTGRLPSVYEYY